MVKICLLVFKKWWMRTVQTQDTQWSQCHPAGNRQYNKNSFLLLEVLFLNQETDKTLFHEWEIWSLNLQFLNQGRKSVDPNFKENENMDLFRKTSCVTECIKFFLYKMFLLVISFCKIISNRLNKTYYEQKSQKIH